VKRLATASRDLPTPRLARDRTGIRQSRAFSLEPSLRIGS
jgi:hypothetical protein